MLKDDIIGRMIKGWDDDRSRPSARFGDWPRRAALEIDLIVVGLLALLMIPIVTGTIGPLRIILGLVVLFLLPGYTITSVAFPYRHQLGWLERLAFSFGLSVATTLLVGLGLNYTPWGIRPVPLLVVLLPASLVIMVFALYRRSQLPSAQRFQPSRSLWGFLTSDWWRRQPRRVHVLIVMLVATPVLLLLALSTPAGDAWRQSLPLMPRDAERFTEFYLLDHGGGVRDFERSVVAGTPLTMRLVLINNEFQSMQYRLEVTLDDQLIEVFGPLSLEAAAGWEQTFTFRPTSVGPNRRLEFRLFRDETQSPQQVLHRWIDVLEP